MNKRKLALVLVLILLVNIFQINRNTLITASAANGIFKWNKNDTLDTALNIIQNKAGDDDIFLECEMISSGGYDLEYYLEDGQKTTVHFDQQYDRLKVSYKIEQMMDATVTPVTTSNITQAEINKAFLEMDYTSSVPDWKFISNKLVGPSGGLEYTILKNASSKYSGVAFQINGKKVILKWDFLSNKLYYLIVGYHAGTILPVAYTTPTPITQTIKILKALENFQVKPTHLEASGGNNIETNPIPLPGTINPGSKPGLQIIFEQPKELGTDWIYRPAVNLSELKGIVEVADIASNNYTDFNFSLNGAAGSTIAELPNATTTNLGVSYVYDVAKNQYQVDIVKDKSTLAHKDQIIEWDGLAQSKIYNVKIDIQVGAGFAEYEFGSFLPQTKFAYTYMGFEIKRSNMTEAYLDIVPYDIGSQDEVEYTILYSKVIKPVLDPDDDLWVKHYYSSQQSNDNIFIPVPFKKDSSQDVYQVLVNFAGTDLSSQVLNYRAKDDMNVPPTTPKIEAIDNLYVVPSQVVDDNNPSKVQFDLVFSAPDNRNTAELNTIFESDPLNNRIYYELLVNDVPSDTAINPFKVVKVFEVYKQDGLYKIQVDSRLSGTETPSSRINFVNGYNSIDELFRMDDINIFSGTSWTNVINTLVDENTDTYTVTDSGTPYNFEFPGINYVRLRAITKIDNKLGVSYESIPVSLSLSMMKYDIPIASGLDYSPLIVETSTPPGLGITLDWHSVVAQTYEDHMLYPLGKQVDQLTYGIYVSQSSSAILDLDPQQPDGDPDDPDSDYINWEDPSNTEDTIINFLRDNKVTYFDVDSDMDINTMLSADLLGLDKNTNYFIRVVTKLKVSGEPALRMSEPSSMLSVTTPVIPEPPNEGDLNPLSVENFKAELMEDSLISAKLSWTYPDEIAFAKDMYAFEVMSIEDRSLPDVVSSSGLMLEDLIGNAALSTDQVEMWRVIVEGNAAVLKKYDKVSGLWDNQPASLLILGDHSISIIDGSNTPNKVYYYYARTINVVGGNVNSASPWQKDTLTTAPVKGPINLAVTYNSGYTYNPKTESIIRFDAPIPLHSNLANDYVMEIFVKAEDDADYSNTKYPTTYLQENTEGEVGYTRFIYRIAGLKPGKAYSIKVRIEDRTKPMDQLPDGTGVYPKSPFSERIIARTEFDQAEYDKEIKYKEYLDYYDQKVKELSQGPYFVLEKTTTKNVVKYRDTYALGDLQGKANGTYSLFVENVKTNIIYLPAEFVEAVNTNKVTLKVEGTGQSVSIRPFSIGKSITKAINDQVTEIQKYGTTAKDYYVKLTIDSSTSTVTINSKNPASTLVELKVEIVGSNQIENDIDILMVKELENIIGWKRSLLKSELSIELNNGIDDKKMLKIAQDALEVAKTNFRFSCNVVMSNKLLTTTKVVTVLSKNVVLSILPTSMNTALAALKKVGTSWQQQPSSYLVDRYVIETADMTSYVLVPQEVTTISYGGKYSTAEIEVINKYHLTDIFNSSELSSGTINLEKYRMIPAFARLLGAPAGSNDQQFLKDKGITISTTNMYSNLSRAEVLYLHTLVFAKKNAITLSNAKILNYNMIQDLSKVNETYRNTLLIGANMGIYKLNNGLIQPDNKVTIKEFIEMLTKIDNGLNW